MAGGSSSRSADPVERLIDAFTDLPGVGRRSAERIAFHLLTVEPERARRLSQAIRDIKENVRHCAICSALTDQQRCHICENPRRDASVVLVVEQPKDMISLEQTGSFRGVYHVLCGRIDPLNGVEPGDLTVASFLERIDDPAANSRGERVSEVILGLNPDLEGDSTALYLTEQLRERNVRITRLARGLPTGSQLEYVSKAVLMDAIEGRQSLDR